LSTPLYNKPLYLVSASANSFAACAPIEFPATFKDDNTLQHTQTHTHRSTLVTQESHGKQPTIALTGLP
jgi:hypothetical protein